MKKKKVPDNQPKLFDDKPQQGARAGFLKDHPVVETVKKTLGAEKVRFDGPVYEPKHDDVRLAGQILRVFNHMKDTQWRTLDEIANFTGDPHASISAQLRHLRKKKFGSHVVNKRSRGDRDSGLWEYQLIVNKEGK